MLEELARVGVDVTSGHDARNVRDADVVLWSPAVAARQRRTGRGASARGRHDVARRRLWLNWRAQRRVIGVTGHPRQDHRDVDAGARAARRAVATTDDSSAPTCSAWARTVTGGAATSCVEVDESYGTFALVAPYALGLLNVEADHLDHYGSLDDLEARLRDARRAHRRDRSSSGVDDDGAARVSRARRARRSLASVPVTTSTWRVSDVALVAPRRVVHACAVPSVDARADIGRDGRAQRRQRRGRRGPGDRTRRCPLDDVTAGLAHFRGRAATIRASAARGTASTSTRATRTCPARSRAILDGHARRGLRTDHWRSSNPIA